MYEEITIEELVKFQPKELREYTISDADYTDHACSFRDGLCRQRSKPGRGDHIFR